MSGWSRNQFHRVARNPTPPPLEEMAENPNGNPNGPPPNGNNNNPPVRTMRDILNPSRVTHPSCIVTPEGNALAVFTVKPQHIQMLPHYHGMASEQTYLHIRDFEEVVHSFFTNPLQLESAKMKQIGRAHV